MVKTLKSEQMLDQPLILQRCALQRLFGISCSSLVTLVHPRSRHSHATAWGRGVVGGGLGVGGPRWVTGTLPLGRSGARSYKTRRWRRSGSDSPLAQVRLADTDARHGAHIPRAVLFPGVVSVRPQGRLQVYRGKFQDGRDVILSMKHSNCTNVCFYPQNNDILKDELYSFFNSELKRETPEELMYRRPLRES